MAAQPMKMLVWNVCGLNVCGLNSPTRRSAIYQVVVAAGPSLACFQETKMGIVTIEIVKKCLGNKFEGFYYLSAVGSRDGVLIAWDPLLVMLSNPHTTENTLTPHTIFT